MAEPTTGDPTRAAWKETVAWATGAAAREIIRSYLGAEYPPRDLIRIYAAMLKDEEVADEEVLDLLEMFLYFAEHTLGFTFGLDLLNHFLLRNGEQKVLDPSLLTGSADFRNNVCNTFGALFQAEIERRVLDASSGSHPAAARVLRDSVGNNFAVTPAPSVLRAGGTETLYEQQTNVVVSRVEESERGMALGGIGVVCELTVTTTVTAPGEWQVAVDGWRCWAWDTGDFNRKTQNLPIDLLSYVPGPLREEAAKKLVKGGIPSQYHDRIMIRDRYLDQLTKAKKPIVKKSVVTRQEVQYYPADFPILFLPWEFTDRPPNCIATVVKEPPPPAP